MSEWWDDSGFGFGSYDDEGPDYDPELDDLEERALEAADIEESNLEYIFGNEAEMIDLYVDVFEQAMP